MKVSKIYCVLYFDSPTQIPFFVFYFQVNPNSIAAMDGRIRKGDRILQVQQEPA